MINLLDFESWWRFGVALLIGALLGMEREFILQAQKNYVGLLFVLLQYVAHAGKSA